MGLEWTTESDSSDFRVSNIDEDPGTVLDSRFVPKDKLLFCGLELGRNYIVVSVLWSKEEDIRSDGFAGMDGLRNTFQEGIDGTVDGMIIL